MIGFLDSTVVLAAGDSEAYDALVEEICRQCEVWMDLVSFQFTARYGSGGLLREVLIAVNGQEFTLRPGERLRLDPDVEPHRWSIG